MVNYDYIAGKKRVTGILNNKLDVIKQNKIPNEDEFTFDNGYFGWVTAIFVDIRDSTSLFADTDKEKVSKIIRSFTSEIIEILKGDNNLREIGIRGDCVYAIYTTPTKDNEYEIANKSFYINSYMKMLNMLLTNKGYPTISVGIGVATAQELVVKAGEKGSGINNKVWIGKAVSKASNLSSLGNKNNVKTIVFSDSSYDNFIDSLIKENKDAPKWFTKTFDSDNGYYYHANIIQTAFNNWINNGMK